MNKSISITPAANGYIVSTFDDNTPDHVFRTFEELVAHLRRELPVHPVLKETGLERYRPADTPPPYVGGIGPRTMFEGFLSSRPIEGECSASLKKGGSGCPVCDTDVQSVL